MNPVLERIQKHELAEDQTWVLAVCSTLLDKIHCAINIISGFIYH